MGLNFAHMRPSAMTQQEFLATFGGLYENAPWVAERAFASGLASKHDDRDNLHRLFCTIVAAVPAADQDALINGHPELGGHIAEGQVGVASRGEQKRAGLSASLVEPRPRLEQLNRAYRRKYGMPYIKAVEGLDRKAILVDFERRLTTGTVASERAQALLEINKITLARMRKLL